MHVSHNIDYTKGRSMWKKDGECEFDSGYVCVMGMLFICSCNGYVVYDMFM